MKAGPDLGIQMTCAYCGANLALLNAGRLSGREHTSIWCCTECEAEWQINVAMVPVTFRETASVKRAARGVAQCGTDPGYFAHRRRGEEACVACKRAHADGQAAWARSRRDRRVGVLA